MSSSVPPPSSGFQRPPSPGRDLYEERGAGFSRAGFAPIPQRHQEIPAAEPSRDVPDPARGRRPSWGDRRDELDDGARVGGRGRDEFDRRPPPPRGWDEYDDRPKRRRSPSPFGSSHRPRRHSPSPSRPPISNLPDPAEVPNLLPFRQFADWFRASHPQTAKADEEELIKWREAVEAGQDAGSKDKVGMGKRYERYRKEFHSRQLYTLYLTHRETPWFQEKYSNRPEMIALRRRLNRQGRVPTAEKYLDALRAGDYNTLSFDMTSETDKRSSGGRRNSELEESEGMDRALGDNHADDPLRVEVPPSDRQVFVKTVPPMTSRQELEAMFKRVDGFEYLAITEPAAKKSFHRVAWAQYREGVNVEDVVKQLNGAKIDTFTFHMGVNATSVIGRIRVTAPVSNSLERLLKDGEKAKELAIKLEEDLMGDDEEDAKKAENEGEGKAKTEGDGDKAADETKEASYPGLREQGSVVVQEKIDALLEDEGLSGDLNEERQTIRAKMVLDQWLSYLRHGLSTCYYCVASLPFPEELHRKCVSHLRPHPTTPTEQSLEAVPEGGEANESAETQEEKVRQHDEDDEDRRDADPDKAVAERKSSRDRDRRGGPSSKVQDERWEEGIDSKLKPLLESVDVAEYGGRDIEEETKKVSAPFIKQEEASKYRCKECTKLFKAPEFVLKHISVKHPEVIKAKLEDLPTLNNFVLDPQRLQPVPSTPAAVNDQIPAPALPMMPGGMASLPQMPTFNPAFAGGPGFGGGNGSNMNMMQQQMMMMMQMQQAMMMGMNGMGNGGGGGGRGGLGDRIGGYGPGGPAMSAPLPAPPPGGEDPRAKRGRVSYMDLDEPGGGGGGGLPY